jgi:hypothetical protein
MHSDHSATFSGKVNGAENTVIPSRAIEAFDGLQLPGANLLSCKPAPGPSLSLSRQEPIGLTIIVGGTNVRYCLSHLNSREPATQVFKWQSLRDEYEATAGAGRIGFENSHAVTYPKLARQCGEFFRNHFENPHDPFEVENFSALTFSMAGMVEGDGTSARVTTSNTLLKIRKEDFAEKFISHLKQEIPKLSLKNTHVRVINDAEAGLEGELYFNRIDRNLVTLFIILGTGLGSACTKPGFAELGHLIVFDPKLDKFRFLTKEEFEACKDTDGAFKPLEGLVFAENILAGPWAAIGFVRRLQNHEPPLLTELAKHIATAEEAAARKYALENPDQPPLKIRSTGEIFNELKRIQEFKNGERHLWAGHTNESTLRAVNSLIFDRKHCDLTKRAEAFGSLDTIKATDPKFALDLVAEMEWKRYYRDVGQVAGVVYQRMLDEGLHPHKFIAGGGLGELSNCYGPRLRQQAVDIITEAGNLPEWLFDFSQLSPTARESAPTYQKVIETARKLAH